MASWVHTLPPTVRAECLGALHRELKRVTNDPDPGISANCNKFEQMIIASVTNAQEYVQKFNEKVTQLKGMATHPSYVPPQPIAPVQAAVPKPTVPQARPQVQSVSSVPYPTQLPPAAAPQAPLRPSVPAAYTMQRPSIQQQPTMQQSLALQQQPPLQQQSALPLPPSFNPAFSSASSFPSSMLPMAYQSPYAMPGTMTMNTVMPTMPTMPGARAAAPTVAQKIHAPPSAPSPPSTPSTPTTRPHSTPASKAAQSPMPPHSAPIKGDSKVEPLDSQQEAIRKKLDELRARYLDLFRYALNSKDRVRAEALARIQKAVDFLSNDIPRNRKVPNSSQLLKSLRDIEDLGVQLSSRLTVPPPAAKPEPAPAITVPSLDFLTELDSAIEAIKAHQFDHSLLSALAASLDKPEALATPGFTPEAAAVFNVSPQQMTPSTFVWWGHERSATQSQADVMDVDKS